MNLDDYPLLPVVEEVVAGYRSPLEAEGWTIEVEPNRVPGTVSVKLEHPAVGQDDERRLGVKGRCAQPFRVNP